MSHISLTYHIVWRTKRSQRTITEEHERDLYALYIRYLQGKEMYSISHKFHARSCAYLCRGTSVNRC